MSRCSGTVQGRGSGCGATTPSTGVSESLPASRIREAEAYGLFDNDIDVRWIDREIRLHTERVGLWLDTTHLTADQAAEQIVGDLDRATVPHPEPRIERDDPT